MAEQAAPGTARESALQVLEHAMRGEVERARQVVHASADGAATALELARLLALLLPSYPLEEMTRFIRTARKFDPVDG